MPITSRQTGSLANENWTKIYQTFKGADFTSYDFESLRKTMIDYIKINHSEEFNDFTESSEFIALIDLIAFLGQSLAFRTDLNARENFIDTAERRDSILKLARLISYNPKRNISASGYLKIDSVSTTEVLYDSDGFDLSNRIILWNDNSNSNWFEQFITVVNASLLQHQNFGRPGNSQVLNGIRTEEYGINLINNVLPVYKFEALVNGSIMSFEAVSASSSKRNYIYEKSPNINLPFNILYRNDSNGNGSNNTGFFLYFKQGELSSFDFSIDSARPNTIVSINVNDINNNDIWLYKLDNQGFTDVLWEQVPTTTGINVIHNNSSSRDLYQVATRANDQINLVFGDGSFANAPLGNFKLYYRTSNGLNYKISPDEIRGVPINFDYISKNNRVETVTFRVSLRYTVANASSKETAEEIKQRAPQQYYTQNRMVTGEDYNILPYTTFSDIKKVKAINRISSGLSRFLDTLDTTGKYSSTNIFGEDGVLYTSSSIEVLNFSYQNEVDIRKFIRSKLIPEVIDDKNLMHYYYETVAPKLLESDVITESNLKDNEVYQIQSIGTSNFLNYGATSNTVGSVFRAVDAGIKTRNYIVSGFNTAAFLLNGNTIAYNPDINVKVGDTLVFDVKVNQNFHIKTSPIGGTLGNVTQGIVINNGGINSIVTWNTVNVTPGTYHYVARSLSGRCYDLNAFISFNKGEYTDSQYRTRALAIMPYYKNNNQYTLSNGEIRYGLFRNPDIASLAYWCNYTLANNIDPLSIQFINMFFAAEDRIPGSQRQITPYKEFDSGSWGTCGFYDIPSTWPTNFMVGNIVITAFGTGTVTTDTKWNQSTINNGSCTGFFSYNQTPISIGNSSQSNLRFLNTGGMVKFVPQVGYRFNNNFNMVPGADLRPGDSAEKFSGISQVFGDGSNNGSGNFVNGVGPVTINLPIPTGALVESIIPVYKNALRDFIVDEIVRLMVAQENFGLLYSSNDQNWIIRDASSVLQGNWMIKFDWNSVTNYYVISYKSLKFVFHSPEETNFYFNPNQQIYDSSTNNIVRDSIKVLKSNDSPGTINGSLHSDVEWFVSEEIKRADGFVENRSIMLTYADTNQDGVPDSPNLFDRVVLGGPYQTSVPGVRSRTLAVKVNYEFKRLMGRYPSQSELDLIVQNVINGLYSITDVPNIISASTESKLFFEGAITAQELVFFELKRTNYGNEYTLLPKDSVINFYNTKQEIEDELRLFNVNTLFFARAEKQFYRCVLNKFGNKSVSDGLNLTSPTAVPNYQVHIGRQGLYYQYRHNSPGSNRIDPNISNIIDLFVLTSEYETQYRLWLADNIGILTEPEPPTDLELYNRFRSLESYKTISDTLVIQSAKYKPLFGSKADARFQATFKVVKNISVSITDADVKSQVVAAINLYFASENWDFGDTFYFSELAAYLHKTLVPTIASIVIVSKNLSESFGNLYQINAEPYEILISAATVDDVELVTAISAIDLQPSLNQ